MISFVGAGPGAADLLTLRARQRLADADVVVWASSLVSPDVLSACRSGVRLVDSAPLTLDEIIAIFEAHPDDTIVRLHSGDPAVYGAISEQIAWCRRVGRDFEIVPGVSSLGAAAAAAGIELTAPGVSQSVVLTRLPDRTRASFSDAELDAGGVAGLAAHGATMAVFLSAAHPDRLRTELLAPGSAYTESTPVVVASRVSHADEVIVHGRLGDLASLVAEVGRTTTVLVLVGPACAGADPPRPSHVYAADYSHSFRQPR